MNLSPPPNTSGSISVWVSSVHRALEPELGEVTDGLVKALEQRRSEAAL